jgi:hypothetical protein
MARKVRARKQLCSFLPLFRKRMSSRPPDLTRESSVDMVVDMVRVTAALPQA